MTQFERDEAFASLFAEGKIVRKLDENGEPALGLDADGTLGQRWVADVHATPEEMAYWRKEHGIVEYVN